MTGYLFSARTLVLILIVSIIMVALALFIVNVQESQQQMEQIGTELKYLPHLLLYS